MGPSGPPGPRQSRIDNRTARPRMGTRFDTSDKTAALMTSGPPWVTGYSSAARRLPLLTVRVAGFPQGLPEAFAPQAAPNVPEGMASARRVTRTRTRPGGEDRGVHRMPGRVTPHGPVGLFRRRIADPRI